MASTLKISAPEHPIKSVTVFKSSKAEVVRAFSLELKAGQNKVEIRSLPSAIDTHSVRVSGLGDARLFDVVCTIGADKDAFYAFNSPPEVIRRLKVKRETLEGEKSIREREAELLVAYTKTLTGEHVTPIQMSEFLSSFIEQGRKNMEVVTAINEKIIDVERQIEKEAERSKLKKGTAGGEIVVILGTDIDCSVDLKLTYIVSNVQWKPIYELHATTENGKPSSSVALHYRARLTQSTGEDWSNTTLTLSTVTSDTMVKKIPELAPLKIRPHNPFIPKKGGLFGNQPTIQKPGANQFQHFGQGTAFGGSQAAQMGQLFGQAATSSIFQTVQPPLQQPTVGGSISYSASQVEDFEDVQAPGSIAEPATIVTETPIAISYSVQGQSTIPSDGIEHQVTVAVLPFEAELSYVTIPRIEPRVYLQCQVKNTSEYRLLSGPVSVIMDDSYVSKTSINDINIGDNFDCTLGDDSATKVTYSRSSRTTKVNSGSFSEQMNITTHNTKISIQNKHQFAIHDLVVRDILPTCDDRGVKVILNKPEGLADAKEGQVVRVAGKEGLGVMWEKSVDGKGGEKEGKFEWKWNVAAGSKVTLESEWAIKAPTDVKWVEEHST